MQQAQAEKTHFQRQAASVQILLPTLKVRKSYSFIQQTVVRAFYLPVVVLGPEDKNRTRPLPS